MFTKYGEQLLDSTLLYDILVTELPLFGLLLVLVFFLYFSILEGRFQSTIGKKLLGLRVVRTDFSKCGYRESVVRNVLRLIWELPIVGLLFMIVDAFLVFMRHQRIGDIAAKTYVLTR
jgi:uncharacterized RDD family membrane protein YckC